MSEGSDDLYRESSGDDEQEVDVEEEEDAFEGIFGLLCNAIRAVGYAPRFDATQAGGWAAFYDSILKVVDIYFDRK